MRNSCVAVVPEKVSMLQTLAESHKALSSLGEQHATHRGKFVVISFGERCLL